MDLRPLGARLFPFLVPAYSKWSSARARKRYANLSVEETFTRVYETKHWGETPGRKYCSGPGSSSKFGSDYSKMVNDIIRTRGVRRVVDVGCGDFSIGSLLDIGGDVSYVGLDVVRGLIAENQAKYGRPGVEFRHANVLEDELPDADLCLIRQVLQHLSNDEVARILGRCAKYPLLIVTEDLYSGPDAVPNLDKPHGPDLRAVDKSGVYLDLPPFNISGRSVLEMQATKTTLLRTTLIENDPSNASQPAPAAS